MYKAVTALLILILFSVIALNVYTIRQQEPKPTPIPQPPLPSVVPTTDSPREVIKDTTIEYKKAQVEIKNFTAIPNTLTIKTNTTVTWTNFDKDPHQIVGDKWKSYVMKENDKFSQSFEKPGNFLYKDPSSPQLNGVIIVE